VRDSLPGGVTDRGPGQGADRSEDNCPGDSPNRGIAGPFLRCHAHRNDGDGGNKHPYDELHESPSTPSRWPTNAAI
jgi:hypothetical protein